MDRARAGSPDELKQHNLDGVRRVSVLKAKASDEEVEEYRVHPRPGRAGGRPARRFMGLSGERESDAERAAMGTSKPLA
jgi:hypothetical protein